VHLADLRPGRRLDGCLSCLEAQTEVPVELGLQGQCHAGSLCACSRCD
jgi:hypothetical protein